MHRCVGVSICPFDVKFQIYQGVVWYPWSHIHASLSSRRAGLHVKQLCGKVLISSFQPDCVYAIIAVASQHIHGCMCRRCQASDTTLQNCLQVPVIQLLGHLWTYLVAAETTATVAATGSGRSSSSATAAPHVPESSSGSIAAALPGILSYLSVSLSSLNPAVKLEAARVVLRLIKAQGRGSAAAGGSIGSSSGLLDRLRLVGTVPPATAAAAIEVSVKSLMRF